MKTCFKCNRMLDLDCFYEHPRMLDGHLNKCKSCTRSDNKNNRQKRIEYYRQYDEKRYAKNGKRGGGKYDPKYNRNWRGKNKEKYKAHSLVAAAVKNGTLKKPSRCECCGEQKRIVGHHEDYSKPLDVFWVCDACHSFIHALGDY